MNNGNGGKEGAIARQHDVQAIKNMVKRFFKIKKNEKNKKENNLEGKKEIE
ncbi:hypothetical protein GLN41_22765 [Shigella flexneri]|uniref:hypothetical protein n=1 Tax=Shigella flexneri TaxID=623 RepID=UPI0012E797FB|nr:hypothetical protein [Shigella flexneri]MUZ24430.1 hypothetical protein [Shigella flexneri]